MSSEHLFGVVRAGVEEVAIPAAALREVLAAPLPLNPHAGLPAHALGSFNLRGVAVPAVDLRALLGVSSATPFSHMVILRTARGQLGLAVDGISDMLRVPEAHIHPLHGSNGATAHPLAAALLMAPDQKLARLILNQEALAARPDIAWGGGGTEAELASATREWRLLHFEMRDHRFCFDIATVREIVPYPQLETFNAESRLFRGMIRLRGSRIPVLDLSALLQLPPDATPCPQMLVLGGSAGTVAVPVRAVIGMSSHAAAELVPLPGIGLPRRELMRGTLQALGCRSLLLDHVAILACNEVAGMSRLHVEPATSVKEGAGADWEMEDVLTFEAGGNLYSVVLRMVQEIMSLPPAPLRLQEGFVHGLVESRGAMVPLVALRQLLGLGAPLPDSRVLIVPQGGRRTGFIVDKTSAIKQLALKAEEAPLHPPAQGGPEALLRAAIRSVPARDKDRTIPLALVDLASLAQWLDPSPAT